MTRAQFIQYLRDKGVITPEVQQVLSETRPHAREPIGMIAVQYGLIRGHQIDDILDALRGSKYRFGELAVRMSLLRQEQVERLLEVQRFRATADLAETLVLAGHMDFKRAIELLNGFLQSECGDETLRETEAEITVATRDHQRG